LTGIAAICILNSSGYAGKRRMRFFVARTTLWRFLFICSQVTAADGKLLAARAGERQFQFAGMNAPSFVILYCTLRFVPR
jgi:hypothetical protein